MDKNTIYGFVALAVIAVAVIVGVTNTNSPTANVVNEVAPTGDSQSFAAPAFTVQTIEGETISTETNKAEGKPMVVYFMASTCSSCAKNWKNIDEVYPEYKDKVELVAISVDPTDDREILSKLAADKGFTFKTVEGNPQLAIEYDVKKQTAKFAIDGNGNIISRHDGVLTPQEWKDLFESVL